MWFDDDSGLMNTRLSASRRAFRRNSVNVSVRLRAQRDARANRAAIVTMIVVAAVAAVVLLGYAFVKTGEALYSCNDHFKIVNLEIKTGRMMTPELIREYTRIREGGNVFGFNATRVRREFLSRAANVKGMTITRSLPDTVRIEVVEREAVACLGAPEAVLVVDREGYVFRQRSGRAHLPAITGYREGAVRPGEMLVGPALAALEILDACEDPRMAFQVDAVDVSREEYVVIQIPYAEVRRELRLNWPGMGTRTQESSHQLLQKLGRILQVLQSEAGKRYTRLDATLEGGRIYGQ